MDMKLNHSDLSALFAKSLGLSVADAENFTKVFFDTIVEGLENEGLVKINGLGTFKVVEVDSRSSVNVNTGERIEIKGHKKMNFLPAESLKDVINAPFAMFEPVEVDDELVDDEPQTDVEEGDDVDMAEEESPVIAEEPSLSTPPIEDIIEELPAEPVDVAPSPKVVEYDEEMPVEDVPSAPSSAPLRGKVVQPDNVNVALPEVEEPQEEEPMESEAVAETAISEVSAEETPIIEEEANLSDEKAEEGANESASNAVVEQDDLLGVAREEQQQMEDNQKGLDASSKKRTINAKLLFIAMVLLLLAGAVVYLLNNKEAAVVESVATTSEAVSQNRVVDVVTDTVSRIETNTNDTVAVEGSKEISGSAVQPQQEETFVVTEALAARKLSVITVVDTVDYKMVGSMCEHVVASDETLIKISLKHYGDKRLWPYIVAYNKMSRPNDLACGMILKIPRLLPAK